MFGTAGLPVSLAAGRFLIFIALTFFISCKQKGSQDNECFYELVETHAEVIDLKPHPEGNGRIAVVLDFKASSLALDDQELGDLKDIQIDHAFLERNHIEIGNKYEVTVSELSKGDCENKLIVAFNHKLE